MMSFSVFQSYPKCEVSSSQTSSLWISEWIMTIMSESCNVGGKPAGKVLIKKVARLLLTSALISAEFIAPQWKFQGWEEKVSESTISTVPRRHNSTLPLAAQIGTTFFYVFLSFSRQQTRRRLCANDNHRVEHDFGDAKECQRQTWREEKNTFRINNKPQDLSRTNYFGPRIDISRIARKIWLAKQLC